MSAVVSVTALTLPTWAESVSYYSTQTCSKPPGGTANVCVTLKWEKFTAGTSYITVRPVEVKYVNSSAANGTATFNQNGFVSYTISGGKCVLPYTYTASYGTIVVAKGATIYYNPSFQSRSWSQYPVFTTLVSINGGSTLRLYVRP